MWFIATLFWELQPLIPKHKKEYNLCLKGFTPHSAGQRIGSSNEIDKLIQEGKIKTNQTKPTIIYWQPKKCIKKNKFFNRVGVFLPPGSKVREKWKVVV